MEVTLFPYLPLAERRVIGPWELIPRERLRANDTGGEQNRERALDVLALYRLPGNDSRGYGAFIRPIDARVGDDADRLGLPILQDAVAVALLDVNPSRLDEEQDPNAGHRICMTENALLFGHRFGIDLLTGFETGTMVVHQTVGPQVGEARDVIEPPAEMFLAVVQADLRRGLRRRRVPGAGR